MKSILIPLACGVPLIDIERKLDAEDEQRNCGTFWPRAFALAAAVAVAVALAFLAKGSD